MFMMQSLFWFFTFSEIFTCVLHWTYLALVIFSTTNWFPSVFWHCWFGHLACKNSPQNDL